MKDRIWTDKVFKINPYHLGDEKEIENIKWICMLLTYIPYELNSNDNLCL